MPPGSSSSSSASSSSTVDIRAYSQCLQELPNGVWGTSAELELSYPEDGNEQCLAVEEGSFWFRHRNQVIVDLVRRYPPSGPLFDVGAGNGFVSLALRDAGLPVVVLEPGPSGAASARARGLDPVVQAPLEEAGFAVGSLPAVAFFDVVEHLEDDVRLLTAAARLLAPRGRVYVTVPAHHWLWSEDDVRAGHFRRYRRPSLRAALEEAGLRVEWVSHFFAPLALPILFSRVLLARLRTTDWSPRRAVAQHDAGPSLLARPLEWVLGAERRWLRSHRGLPLGSSLIAVARKAADPAAGSRQHE